MRRRTLPTLKLGQCWQHVSNTLLSLGLAFSIQNMLTRADFMLERSLLDCRKGRGIEAAADPRDVLPPGQNILGPLM